jgi:putative hydrolase of the HAD superfamily
MLRAALFDFGGVILSSPFEAFARYEREHGLPDGLIRRINATNPDDNAWAKLERSEVDLDGFAELFEAEAASLGHRVDGRAVIGLLGGEWTANRTGGVAARLDSRLTRRISWVSPWAS